MRISHEMKTHSSASFVTLTYNPESLPRGGTLVRRHLQLFVKRLREALEPIRIRYFAVGEYGEELERPHYHLLVFGWFPADAKLFAHGDGYDVYTSEIIASAWEYGFHTVSAGSVENALYVAGYATKKMNGERAKDHYTRITRDGEMIEVLPEFALMSRRPGIGAGFYSQFESDFRNHDYAVFNGKKQRVPRYYDKLYQRKELHKLESIKEARRAKARAHRADQTPERLAVRELVHNAKLKFNKERKSR